LTATNGKHEILAHALPDSGRGGRYGNGVERTRQNAFRLIESASSLTALKFSYDNRHPIFDEVSVLSGKHSKMTRSPLPLETRGCSAGLLKWQAETA
jgi:hypothetical protein